MLLGVQQGSGRTLHLHGVLKLWSRSWSVAVPDDEELKPVSVIPLLTFKLFSLLTSVIDRCADCVKPSLLLSSYSSLPDMRHRHQHHHHHHLHDHADHDVRDHNSDADNDDHVGFVIATQGMRILLVFARAVSACWLEIRNCLLYTSPSPRDS